MKPDTMNSRERFLATMRFEKGVRPPKWELDYWAGTLRRWYGEGLVARHGIPKSVPFGEGVPGEMSAINPDSAFSWDVHETMGFDEGMQRIPLESFVFPLFDIEILEDHDDRQLRTTSYGGIVRAPKDSGSIPAVVKSPVTSLEEWEVFKAERLVPEAADRLPSDWPERRARLLSRTFPLAASIRGLFGAPRSLMGVEGLLLAYYDQPDLVRAMVNDLVTFTIALYEPILREVQPDLGVIWEDMSFKNGPFISPAMVREFLLPGYKRLTAFFRSHGVNIIFLDTDGDCRPLIPVFLEGGITGLYPWEATSGQNIVDVRQAFPNLQMSGGLDKKALIAGPAAIDRELESKVPSMLQSGGYIPTVDHGVPADVSWDNFRYYRGRLDEIMGS